MTELSKLRGDLDTLCKKHGPNTPLGSRYSMLNQLAGNYETAGNQTQREAIVAAILRANAAIAQIIEDGGEYIEAHHVLIERTRQAGEG